MRILIFTAGALIGLLGFLSFKKPEDFPLLQGGLTLGGGLIICGLFSIRSKWHGLAGAGILSFLGLTRTVPAFWSMREGGATARFEAAVAVLCLIVFVVTLRAFLAERTRIAIERLKAGDDDPRR